MATQYYVTVPGQKKQSVIVPDTCSWSLFCEYVFKLTGIRIFNGFGVIGQGGSTVTVPRISGANNATIWDGTTQLSLGDFLIPAPAQATGTSSTAAGSLTSGSYYAVVTYVNPAGETVASAESAAIVLASTGEVIVNSPVAVADATGWNCYLCKTTPGTEKLQNGSPVAIGTNFTVTTLLSVTSPPVTNTASSPLLASTPVSSLGIANNDELIVFNVPVGG